MVETAPVVLCTRTILDEEGIFLSRGPVLRKEGPKSRRPIPPQGFVTHVNGIELERRTPRENPEINLSD